jgi:uncharacterized RDD family membrane protein YckC
MKCEKCDKELPGAAVICRSCGYNNALQGISNRRQRLATTAVTDRRPTAPAQDATLIQFPVNTGNGGTRGATPTESNQPDWRMQVKEKVRESRTRRGQEEAATLARSGNGSSSTITNPFVQAAVSRIRRAVPAPPRGVAHNMQATARAIEYHEESRPVPQRQSPAPEPQRAPELVLTPEVQREPTTQPLPRLEARVEARVLPQPVEAPPPVASHLIPEAEPAHLLAEQALPELPQPAGSTPQYAELQPMPFPGPRVEIEPAPVAAESVATQVAVPVYIPEIQAKPAYVFKRDVVRETAMTVDLPFDDLDQAVDDRKIISIDEVAEQRTDRLPKWEPSRTPASLHRRILAGGIDLEIVALSFLPVFSFFALLDSGLNPRTLFMMGGSAIGLIFMYQFLMLLVAGRTCGMAVLKLDLTDVRGDCMALKRGRVFARAIGATLGVLLTPINLALVLSSAHRRSMADRFSGSIVVKQ